MSSLLHPATVSGPCPPSSSSHMQHRGRSRQVSQAALARKASQERYRTSTAHQRHRTRNHPTSPSPSPPPPLRSIPLLHTPTLKFSQPPIHLEKRPTPLSRQVAADASNDTLSRPVPSIFTLAAISACTSSPPSKPPSLTSSISVSSDDCESPSTTESLEDQIHVAYALDDIHRAKILLLRLKGIEVESDNDPRIDQVQDEDFDICFAPSGRLTLDAEDEKAVKEAQRREREKWEERKRMERLRACERIWDEEKRRLRAEKTKIQKQKDRHLAALALEAEQRAAREREAEAERNKYQERLSFRRSQLQSRMASPPKEEDRFRYEIMMPPTLAGVNKYRSPPRNTSSLSSRRELSSASSSTFIPPLGCNAVSFKEVLNSMHGPLFPVEAPEQQQQAHAKQHRHTASQSSTASASQQARSSELVASLLKVVEWENGERTRAKGKAPAPVRPAIYRSGSSVISTGKDSCAACSAVSESSSSSVSAASSAPSTAMSRSSSWLSFGSRGTSSTGATSPSPSPRSSWLKPSGLSTASILSPSLIIPLSVAEPKSRPPTLRHSCQPGLTLVPPSECPLTSTPAAHLGKHADIPCAVHAQQDVRGLPRAAAADTALVKRVRQGVSSFMTLAKGFQTSYMGVTLLSVTASYDSLSYSSVRTVTPPQKADSQPRSVSAKPLKPSGYRVRRADVTSFASPSDFYVPESTPPHFIPLTSHLTSPHLRSHIHTPHPLVFPPPASLSRSPFRPETPPPPGAVLWRMRPVANPVVLRLRALQNVLFERGCGWEGRAREGGLGCGKERVVGVAFEGLGPSGLSTGRVLVG